MSEFVERNNKMKTKLTAMVLALGAMLGAFGAWNGNLSTLKGDATAASGTVITGTLAADVNVSIAAGATVTLQNANITNTTDYNYSGALCHPFRSEYGRIIPVGELHG